jgi:hypothetical protein
MPKARFSAAFTLSHQLHDDFEQLYENDDIDAIGNQFTHVLNDPRTNVDFCQEVSRTKALPLA